MKSVTASAEQVAVSPGYTALDVVGNEMNLPPTQRAVIERRYVEGRDAAEVCELVEIS
jgi:DNA-directed RNA polymerase specialized sigma24 family protein